MQKVIVETPYSSDRPLNIAYLKACLRNCILRNESPYASHWMIAESGILNEDDPAERKLGIELGHLWITHDNTSIFYLDRGFSHGMALGLQARLRIDRKFIFRILGGEWANNPAWETSVEKAVAALTEAGINFGEIKIEA